MKEFSAKKFFLLLLIFFFLVFGGEAFFSKTEGFNFFQIYFIAVFLPVFFLEEKAAKKTAFCAGLILDIFSFRFFGLFAFVFFLGSLLVKRLSHFFKNYSFFSFLVLLGIFLLFSKAVSLGLIFIFGKIFGWK